MEPADPAQSVATTADPTTADAAPSPEAYVEALDERARPVRTSIHGGGSMVWRIWGSGPPLLLLHGGHGSWRHFARNIEALAQDSTVMAVDMPGFGDSDRPPEPTTIDTMAEIVASGAKEILGQSTHYGVVGFSFGSVVGSHLTRWSDDTIDQLVLIGVNRLEIWPVKRPPMSNWRKAQTPEERTAAHRHNLAAMMIYDPDRIDDLAVYLQTENTRRARIRSLDMVASHAVPECLRKTDVPITAIWGKHDVTLITGSDDAIKGLHNIAPEAGTVVIDGAGHWVQYEAAERFNREIAEVLKTSRA